MAKSITRSISLKAETYYAISDYAERYFQGNMSAAIGYSCLKFIEHEQVINDMMYNLSKAPIYMGARPLPGSSAQEEEKDVFDFDMASSNIANLLGGDG